MHKLQEKKDQTTTYNKMIPLQLLDGQIINSQTIDNIKIKFSSQKESDQERNYMVTNIVTSPYLIYYARNLCNIHAINFPPYLGFFFSNLFVSLLYQHHIQNLYVTEHVYRSGFSRKCIIETNQNHAMKTFYANIGVDTPISLYI